MATPEADDVIHTIEMHTGGEPLRIIQSGYPPVLGDTILEKRRYAQEHLDHLRLMLMSEPRGHYDMYGALLVEKDIPEADMAVLFLHNEGYSTMCGHAVIALGRYAIDYKLVKPVSPETTVKIQCPCGLVTASVEYSDGKTGAVRFQSVPAFCFAVDQKIAVEGYGEIKYDIGYGGAFYAIVDIAQFSLDLSSSPIHELIRAADSLSTAIKKSVTLSHPESNDLAFLYGTILTDGKDECPESANLLVFADCQVDRSPTGSGVTTRVAVQYFKGQLKIGERRTFVNSKVGSKFTASPMRAFKYGCYDNAVIVEVGGKGFYVGEGRWWKEKDDELAKGFWIK